MTLEDSPNSSIETARKLKGLQMADAIGKQGGLDVTIQQENKLTYKVKSQSQDNVWYHVVKQYGSNHGERKTGDWTCECPDFAHRHMQCKHIHAVLFSKLLGKKIYRDVLLQSPISQDLLDKAKKLGQVICPRCGSRDYQKFGFRYNKKNERLQRYKCNYCNRKFIFNPGFEHAKASALVITASIDLYFKGMSLRKIEDHIKQFYHVSISDSAVSHWLRKFNTIVQPYVDSFVPSRVGGVYHVDEMLLHVRKENNTPIMTLENKENHTHRKFDNHYSWLWNVMDSRTRFWICSRISQRRNANSATQVLKEMKQRAPLPKAFVHDGLRTYDEVYQSELYTLKNPRILNVRSVGVSKKGLNSRLERLNGTVRDREIVMRGLDTAQSTQELMDAMRIHYNFIRPNMAIGGQTPAEAAGINLNLGENKVETLMRQAAIHTKEAQAEPLPFKGLGIRIHKVQVLYENDCVEVKPKGWLDKKTWREINDILRVQGYGWFADGKDSCWIRHLDVKAPLQQRSGVNTLTE
jgi:putative transposase